MTENDKRFFAEAISRVFLHYNQEVTTTQLETFWNALKKHPIELVTGALNAHVHHPDEGRFAPKIANILRAIDGGIEERATYAWTLVDQGVRRAGYYRDVIFEDPIIHHIIDRMGGWMDICQTRTEDDFKFKGVEFVKNYRSMYGTQMAMSPPPVLLGYNSVLKNKGHNVKVEEPILIGTDMVKLESVIRSLTVQKPKLIKKLEARDLLQRIGYNQQEGIPSFRIEQKQEV